MLQMTDRAADLLRNLRREAKLPDEAGIRVYSEKADSGEATLTLGFTPDPVPGDQVAEHEGLRLFVAPELAHPLGSAVMDVTADNGESQLIFRPAQEGEDVLAPLDDGDSPQQ
jgi:Fe-S cluster assembly iron-binding protein IscA